VDATAGTAPVTDGQATGDDTPFDVFAAKDKLAGIGVVRDPHPLLHELASRCPVHPGSISGKFGIVGTDNVIYPEDDQVLVLDFHGVERGFRDSETFSSRYVAPALSDVIGRTILEMDPPEHARYRALIQGAFTKKEMERWERDFVREIVGGYVDAIKDRGHGDLAKEVAFHYPITVTARAAGLPVEDVPTFYEQAALLTNAAVPRELRQQAAADLGAMVQALVDERRVRPQDDLISILTQATFKEPDSPDHAQLTDEEIVAFLRLLVPAGAQTTYRSLTNLLCGLLTHPDQLQALYDDRSLIPRAVEEGLRWEGPLLAFGRIATHDTELSGTPIEEGTVVNLCVASANRDPDRWPNPDRFDIFRPTLAHMAFGQGNHICLGIHFARMELRVAMEEILDKLPNLRLAPDAVDVHVDGCTSRTAVSLPCVWDVPA
jgi:cytochrome P450